MLKNFPNNGSHKTYYGWVTWEWPACLRPSQFHGDGFSMGMGPCPGEVGGAQMREFMTDGASGGLR